MRIALLTTGLRPAALRFDELPGEPVGIVDWDERRPSGLRERLENPLTRNALAAARGRRHASLAHLCAARGLRHAALDKRDPDALRRTLSDWGIELVVTSGCPMVPMGALDGLRAGAINLHPSPLPAYRGAEPLLWQLVDAVPTLGASVHRLSARSDGGAVLGRASMPCPVGLSRRALSDAVDGGIGVPLLRSVVAALIRDPELTGEVQPVDSPTPYARRVRLDELEERVPLDGLGTLATWNVLRYAGRCPPGWIGARGWRTRWCWRASSYTLRPHAPIGGGGLWLDWPCADGKVRLLPTGPAR